MGHDRPPEDMRPDDDDRDDSVIAELLRRAYARRVDVDTAARHLWAIDSAGRAARRSARVSRSRRTALSVLTSVLLLATSGVAIGASGGTLPGDPLYSLKRGTERVQLALAVRPETDAQVHLAIARKRWAEAQRAAEARPAVVPDLLKETFVALEAAERRGGDVGSQAVALRSEISESSSRVAFGEQASPAPQPRARRTQPPAEDRAPPQEDAPDPAAPQDPPPSEPPAEAEDPEPTELAASAPTEEPSPPDAETADPGPSTPASASQPPTPATSTPTVADDTPAPGSDPAPAPGDGSAPVASEEQPSAGAPVEEGGEQPAESAQPAEPAGDPDGDADGPDGADGADEVEGADEAPPPAPRWGRARP